MNKLQDGPDLVNDPKEHTNFWDFIHSWGGSWMWDDIDFTQDTTQDLKWVAEGMQNNTLVWTTDRSYDRKRAADLSGVGWIIFCVCVCFWPPVPRWGPVKHEIPISSSPLDDVFFHTLGLSSTTPPETPPRVLARERSNESVVSWFQDSMALGSPTT